MLDLSASRRPISASLALCALIEATASFALYNPALAGNQVPSMYASPVVSSATRIAVSDCHPRRITVLLGAIFGAADLAKAKSFSTLLAEGHTGIYLPWLAMAHVDSPPQEWPSHADDGAADRAAIISTWLPGRISGLEVAFGPALTPSVPSAAAQSSRSEAAFPTVWRPAGYQPTITTLNLSFSAAANPELAYTADQVGIANSAISDLYKTTGAKLVIPFINPNNGNFADFATSSFWAPARSIIASARAVALDTPPNLFNRALPQAYRDATVRELKWAESRGYVTLMLLSPFDMDGGANRTKLQQWGNDVTLLSATQALVAYLKKRNAFPNIYVIDNYSEQPESNAPETEETPNSLAQVALWLSHNAPVAPMPPPFVNTFNGIPNCGG